MGRVIVLGSLITDLVARAERLPQPGETVLGDEFAVFLGGKGFNQAVAAARQGAHVALIGQVGADAYADAFFPALASEGIDAVYVARDSAEGTGVSCVLVGRESGQNMIVATPRANFTLAVAHVQAAFDGLLNQQPSAGSPSSIEEGGQAARSSASPSAGEGGGQEEGSVFLAQCETPMATVRAGLIRARAAGMLTLLNIAPIPREPPDDALFALMALVDVLIPNETEAAALTGIAIDSPASARQAAERLLARGPRHVVITLGAAGYLWCAQGASGTIAHHAEPAITVRAVDATAAGDAFCGTLAASLASGLSLEDALRRANAAGALAASHAGALPSLPTRTQIDALLGGLSA